VTSHSRIAGARLFSEVVTGDEGRAMTLDSVPSESPPTGQSSSTTLGLSGGPLTVRCRNGPTSG
jgi:hypothetical protein